MIDKNDPLACLHKLSEIIETAPSISPETKEPALRFFDHALEITAPDVSKYKPLTLEQPLSENEILTLEHYKSSVQKNHRDRATAILMADRHYTMLDILMATGRPAKTVYGWFRRFKKERINFIKTEIDRSKYNKEATERKNRIIKILHCSPGDFDINRTSWKLGDIARVYEEEYGKKLSTSSIARSIKKTSYSWRRAKRVLTSPDPEYRAKVKKVLDALRTLDSNDTFFFIDECGPYAVKKYGGKSLTLKGTIKTYPQFQKPKGRVTFIAALDALKNQVLLFFAKTKDTDAVVCLIKILYYRYHSYSNLCLTWDCASWHKSKGIQKCIQDLNAKKTGPKIKIVPLPKQSQFLNVIESVFGGMKKAVIFNSDYKSEYEMKMAILRHFQERNAYFKVNPKRAGNKIWDKEYYDLEKIDSGLFRKM